MSNTKHPQCAIRNLANQAKSRLSSNNYRTGEPSVPKNITPQQRNIYLTLCRLRKEGTVLTNPVSQLGDTKKLQSLSHEEKQRYILQLCADYVNVKNLLDNQA